jgi:hypothetical protein
MQAKNDHLVQYKNESETGPPLCSRLSKPTQ